MVEVTKLPSMPFYPADFFADTRHLTCEEQGLYAVMMFHAWLSGGSLPCDEQLLIRILRIHGNRWNRLKKMVLPFWSVETVDNNGSRLFQKRLSRDFEGIVEKIHTNTVNGKLGGRPPKSLLSNGVIKANGFVSHNPNKTQPESESESDKNFLFSGNSRQEGGWRPSKFIGGRRFMAGENAPAYPGQPPDRWQPLKREDCQ